MNVVASVWRLSGRDRASGTGGQSAQGVSPSQVPTRRPQSRPSSQRSLRPQNRPPSQKKSPPTESSAQTKEVPTQPQIPIIKERT